MNAILYRDGYRFQLAQPYTVQTGIRVAVSGNTFVGLAADGTLTIAAGYAWDGASGPVPQVDSIIRGSLVHDALYQLMRECGLSQDYRDEADALLRAHCVEDGMWRPAAWLVYQAVRRFGSSHAAAGSSRPVLTAPALPEHHP